LESAADALTAFKYHGAELRPKVPIPAMIGTEADLASAAVGWVETSEFKAFACL
jgi:hypothetical protein